MKWQMDLIMEACDAEQNDMEYVLMEIALERGMVDMMGEINLTVFRSINGPAMFVGAAAKATEAAVAATMATEIFSVATSTAVTACLVAGWILVRCRRTLFRQS